MTEKLKLKNLEALGIGSWCAQIGNGTVILPGPNAPAFPLSRTNCRALGKT